MVQRDAISRNLRLPELHQEAASAADRRRRIGPGERLPIHIPIHWNVHWRFDGYVGRPLRTLL
jgi:hypothetical protein